MRRRLERYAREAGLVGPFSPWWLVRYFLYRYGHGVAYVVLGLACFIALAMLVQVVNQQKNTDHALALLIKNIQVDRRTSTGQICSANNAVTLRLRQMIVQGAVDSKPFEKLFRAYGLPAYPQRVKRAQAQAKSLPYVPCAVLIDRIKRLTPPPPRVP
jgi:hypothetical protein